MDTNEKQTKKLTLTSLILMIFTSVFGFANMPRSFYLMGYGAIPWFILSAFTFFIPFAFMMSEYGSAFKTEKGGIYSWMKLSVGPKYAFVGTFMWYASYIIWMVNISSTIWIPLSNALFGKDTTANWSILGLNSTQTLGLLGVIWILAVTFTGSKGLEKITKVTSVGGTAVALLNIVLLIGAIIVLVLNGGTLAEPIVSAQSFIKSPNPSYQSSISVLSFLVFAIFSYGGIEVVGGLVDQTENAEVTFPKGLTIAAFIIAIGYSVGIFLTGIFTNWNNVLSTEGVHMGNVAYVVMQNLGYELGQGFGLTEAASLSLGAWVARFVGLSMFLALSGAFFTLSYSPLKQLIEGTPSELWPKKMTVIEDGMPKNAMWIQCIIVFVFILLISFGGEGAAQFFTKLVLMTNVAMTLPYLFLSGAFASFKKKKEIKKPFEIFKTYGSALAATIIVTFTVGFANFFTIIEPAQNGDISSTIWMIVGPLFFTIVSLILYKRYENKIGNKEIKETA
ncbi:MULTISPECIES: glutamate/gamma-aminobutyrate family transporter YjeM [Clostridium]|jgi:amino acid transporter|uniref:Inner membrane transporter YjeM n=1 Tax=Clostridium colicanis DSM 13634 TaxID=1121305 RepID=A0A151AQ52_9CLOT|nr:MULTISPECIES: glutamate/gamma-aminobutyrate family transporter YjeM [Clostridium]KYH29527.1 inner membrane transporter YjeM [Clostridium colicanis DSM 13634]MBE6043847.1 glutamate/gamma-aminobutyrate family transporter YjeM [Clostridium thermopalmarium]